MRGAPPKRPRDASSLILYRHEGRQLKVLLGKRHIKAKFAQDVYVLPGGAVDRSDYPSLPLPVPLASHMGVGKDDRLAHALLTAAIRETREEAGLLLTSGVDHNSLRYIGRAITPVFSPVLSGTMPGFLRRLSICLRVTLGVTVNCMICTGQALTVRCNTP